MKKFWNWIRDETSPKARILRLEGAIAEESWFDDEVTPAAFKAELTAGSGPITVWINSPGSTPTRSRPAFPARSCPISWTAKRG